MRAFFMVVITVEVAMDNQTKTVPVSIGLLVLRVGTGALLLSHGLPKLRQVLGGDWEFMDPIGLGPQLSLIGSMGAEFICALLVIAGLLTRVASIPVIFNFIVAAFIFHASDPWPAPEMAMLYGVAFLTLAFTGGGRFSLDHLIVGRIRNRKQSRSGET